MRWNCPHCGVNLAIGDDKITTSWSFSRCFQCGSYALVRRSEINIIKVDRAPAGEKLILPEASEQPTLSAGAANNLGKSANGQDSNTALASALEKSVVKPASKRNSSPGFVNPLKSGTAPISEGMARAVEAARQASSLPAEALPAGALFGQTLASRLLGERVQVIHPVAGPNAPAGAVADRSIHPVSAYTNDMDNSGLFPASLPEVPSPSNSLKIIPIAVGIAAAIVLGSCLFFFLGDDPPSSDVSPAALNRTGHREHGQPRGQREPSDDSASTHFADTRPVPPVEPKVIAVATVSDQVKSQAMAPNRAPQPPAPIAPRPVQLSSENPPLIVQPKTKNIHLRAGPGMVYPVVGNADETSRYVVTDWNDRWFKVLPQIPRGEIASDENLAGWIRTDSVRVVPEPLMSGD